MFLKSTISSFRGLFLCFAFALISIQAKSQQFKLTQGIAITQFNYQNDQGQNIQGLKSDSGLAFGLAFHKASLVDSAKYKLEQTPFSIYLGQNPKVAKLLSLINYDLGLQFTQLNVLKLGTCEI